MLVPQDYSQVRQHSPLKPRRLIRPPARTQGNGEICLADQRVRMAYAEDARELSMSFCLQSLGLVQFAKVEEAVRQVDRA